MLVNRRFDEISKVLVYGFACAASMVSVDIAGYGAGVATEKAQSKTLVMIRDGTLLRHPSDSTGHSPSKPKQPTKYLSLMSAVFLSPTHQRPCKLSCALQCAQITMRLPPS